MRIHVYMCFFICVYVCMYACMVVCLGIMRQQNTRLIKLALELAPNHRTCRQHRDKRKGQKSKSCVSTMFCVPSGRARNALRDQRMRTYAQGKTRQEWIQCLYMFTCLAIEQEPLYSTAINMIRLVTAGTKKGENKRLPQGNVNTLQIWNSTE